MKKTLMVLAVVLLLGTTPALAADYPTDVTYTTEGGIYEIRKTYEMQANAEPSEEVRQDFTLDGYSYTLVDMLRREMPERELREYTETVTLGSASRELADVLPLLSETRQVTTEDGLCGVLALDASTITVEPAGYRSNSWKVTATRTYPNLSDMDMQYIPKTTTENGRTLSFASVDWQTGNTMNVDDETIGDRYTAVVTYTAVASGKSITSYTVTAQYNGEVEKTTLNKTQYVAIFRGMAIVPPERPMDWRYLAIPAGLLILCAAGFAVAKVKKKKGVQEHEEIQDADYEKIPDDARPDADGGDAPVQYPGVGG